jgi:hypothetical protein
MCDDLIRSKINTAMDVMEMSDLINTTSMDLP